MEPIDRSEMTTRPDALFQLGTEIAACRSCARLVTWRESAAAHPRHVGDPSAYWARGVAGFGDPSARLLVVGLAPAAHGANRTGRLFTGDRSGDFLFAAMHRAGLSNQPESSGVDDGLELKDVFVSAAVRCAPPDNKPTREERETCAPFLAREIELLSNLRAILALGAFAFDAVLQLENVEVIDQKPKPKFAHSRAIAIRGPQRELHLVSAYHPSQRNVFTGLLNATMFDEVLAQISELVSD